MKKTMLFAGIFCLFALVIPGPHLFADIGFGGRIDVGLDLFAVPASATTEEDGMSLIQFPWEDMIKYRNEHGK